MADLIVVTGGAYAGKTSVIEGLSARGHAVLAEAAYEVIGELNEVHGVDGQMKWRRENQVEFQRRVSERQHAREVIARSWSSRYVFCDRGLLDGMAYCRHAGVPWPVDLHQLAVRTTYAHVFVLATLDAFDPRPESGRIDSREGSVAVGSHLEAIYRRQSQSVTRVPVLPIEERIDLVLRTISAPPPQTCGG